MKAKYDSLISKVSWILAHLPPSHTPMKCKRVYKTKVKADGSFDKFKAHLVAKPFYSSPRERDPGLTGYISCKSKVLKRGQKERKIERKKNGEYLIFLT